MPAVSHVPEDSSTSSDGEEQEEHPCLRWAGSNGMVPTLVFYANGIVTKDSNLRVIGERYHLAYKIVRTESRLVRSILTVHGFHEVHPNSNDFNLMWTGSHLKPYLLRTLLEFQKVNHFPRSYELTRKDRLYKNIQRMQQTHGFKHFNIIPQAFILPSEYQELWNAHSKDKGPWIVKPVASSRGRGVYLVSSPSQITTDESILVSRYIRSPLLIDDFKFDVRLYVLVTSYDPLVVYLYEEGLTRFATVKYDRGTRNIKNQFMHLTNYSINKKSRDYVSCDDPEVEDYGNKWSMSAMLRYLKQEGVDTATLMAQIEDLIIKALISAELHIASATKMFVPHKGNCFELYGFDVLIDSNLKPWLLEVNLSPSLACDAPLDLKIKASLLTDMFTLVGFVCHNPIVRQGRQGKTGCDIAARPQNHKQRQLRPVSANNIEVKSRTSSGKERPREGQGLSTLRLTMEEIKVVRRTVEENERKGGFIRIFPTADSWEFYGQFMEHKTTLNYVLAVRLFTGKQGARRPAALARARNGVTQSSQTHCRQEVLQVQSQKHLQQYERKLLSLEARRQKQHQVTLQTSKSKGTESSHTVPVASSCGSGCDVGEEEEATNEEEESEAEVSSLVCNPEGLEKAPISQRVNDEKQQKALKQEVVTKRELSSGQAWTQTKEERNKEQPRANLLQMLQQGGNLSKVQARLAFAAYLHRVQLRLLRECCGQNKITVQSEQEEEQMELVIRFLKRAASNFQQTVPMAVPSSLLPVSERRRILAQQLGVFIRCYSKETDQIIKRNQMDLDLETCIQQEEFQVFVSKASETELEELLTIYTRKNKSASVFLGTQTRNRNQSTSTEEANGKPTRSRQLQCETSCSVPVKPNATSENVPHLSIRGLAMPKEGDSSASDGSGDGSSSTHHIYPARTTLQSAGSLPLPRSLASCTIPAQDLISPEAETVSRAGSAAYRVGSTTPTSHQPQPLGKVQRPSSHNLSFVPASSLQAAAQIYSQKLSRPSSATAGSGARCTQRQRPVTAGVGEGSHRPTLFEDLNNDTISIVLQRLAAKQNPRQYSSSCHVSLLTQHLSNMNLASGALSRGNVFMTPAIHSPISNLGLARTSHSDLQAANSGCVDRTTSVASCPTDGVYPEHRQPFHDALQQLRQQHQLSRQLLQSSRARHQAILAESHLQTLDPSTQGAAPFTTCTQTSPTSNQWPVLQQKLGASQGSPPLLPRPPPTSKQGTARKAGMQRVPRVTAFDGHHLGTPSTFSAKSPLSSSTAETSANPAGNWSERTADPSRLTHPTDPTRPVPTDPSH
ncbi:tubulin polyglutamylase TTLL5 isoform X2 [Pristis pectinata]|uniref:tubulin polyglutamylase TTLL5 isoform X2 n=1 Tax=Pristis pectinata TaxID=685728 RepID=UPI00223D7E06|nr:tubulin polyglutamylase TTLL5 isoform X2 [Pristis pectinata]